MIAATQSSQRKQPKAAVNEKRKVKDDSGDSVSDFVHLGGLHGNITLVFAKTG